jgi:uncharacterized membrane protein
MNYYLLLRLVHIIGFISLGGGLLAVFVSELRAYRTADVNGFAEAAWYTATFYDALVAPGAVLVGLSGLFLIFELGIGFLSEPWLVGMGLPLFLAIVYCGAMRPGDWTHVLGAIVSAVVAAAVLTVGVPKLVRHS